MKREIQPMMARIREKQATQSKGTGRTFMLMGAVVVLIAVFRSAAGV